MNALKFLFYHSSLIALFIGISASPSAGQSWAWNQSGYNPVFIGGADMPVATDKNGNAFITGEYLTLITFGNYTLTSPYINTYLVKYNSAGTVMWAQQLSEPNGGNCVSNSVTTDAAGNIYLAGAFAGGTVQAGTFYLTDNNTSNPDAYIIKYNAAGTVLWAKQSVIPAGNNNSIAEAGTVATDRFGNVFLSGEFGGKASFGSFNLNTSSPDGSNTFLVKYDSNGNELWAAQSITPINDSLTISDEVTTDNNGNAYLAGVFDLTITFGSFTLTNTSLTHASFLVKYSPLGNILWAKQVTNVSSFSTSASTSVVTDMANNIYTTGYFSNTVEFGSHTLKTTGVDNIFLAKYDTNGNVIWAKAPSSAPSVSWIATGLAADVYNRIYLAGISNQNPRTLTFDNYSLQVNPPTTDAAFLMKFDTAGNPICGSMLSGSSQLNGVACERTGTYVYMAGIYSDTLFCGSDTLVAPAGAGTTFLGRWKSCTDAEGVVSLKTSAEEMNVYPNPFTNVTTVAINANGTYYLEIDDLAGRKLNEIEFTGIQYQLSAQGLAKGLYFIRAFDSNKVPIGTSKIVIQ